MEELRKVCFQSVEEVLFRKLFVPAFEFHVMLGKEKDELIELKRRELAGLRPSQLGIKSCETRFNDESLEAIAPFLLALEELDNIAKVTTATTKVGVLVKLLGQICRCVKYHFETSNPSKSRVV